MNPRPRLFSAVLLLLGWWPWAAVPAPSQADGEIIQALAGAVEASAAASRPLHWPMRRACLYYALAGQRLLAHQGVAARLRVGRVVYRPGTPAAHAIAPHSWLETETHFVDYATLPRWGRVEVLPAGHVARDPAQVRPGITPVLALPDPSDLRLRRYLSHHCRRFLGRTAAAARPRSGGASLGLGRWAGGPLLPGSSRLRCLRR